MLSIKLKIVLSYTLLFGILLSLFALIIYQSTEKADIAKLDTKLKSYSVLLQSEIEEQSRETEKFNYSEFKSIPTDGLVNTRFQFFDDNSKMIIGDTIVTKPDPELFASILKGNDEYKKIKNGKHYFRDYISPVEINEKTNHILIVSSSLIEVYEDLDRLFLLFIIVIPLGLILAGISAYLIAKKAFKPISDIIITAGNISAYSLDKRLRIPRTNDEVKALTVTLNSMIDRLDKTFKSHRQFIADASHEIRTPLTVIQTELELALKEINDEQTKESIKTSLSEIENLSRLTNSLLTLAKIDARKSKPELSPVRLDEIIPECIQLLKPAADNKNLKLNISIDDVIEINGDKEKLKSVLINIIDNAIKYSGENKEVYISLKKDNSESAEIEIKDNGPGIPENDLPHIFERFYRSNETRSTVEGNGLGLAIVKEFIEMHKGKIDVKSIPGKGTTFTVLLPAEKSQS